MKEKLNNQVKSSQVKSSQVKSSLTPWLMAMWLSIGGIFWTTTMIAKNADAITKSSIKNICRKEVDKKKIASSEYNMCVNDMIKFALRDGDLEEEWPTDPVASWQEFLKVTNFAQYEQMKKSTSVVWNEYLEKLRKITNGVMQIEGQVWDVKDVKGRDDQPYRRVALTSAVPTNKQADLKTLLSGQIPALIFDVELDISPSCTQLYNSVKNLRQGERYTAVGSGIAVYENLGGRMTRGALSLFDNPVVHLIVSPDMDKSDKTNRCK
jgi:hypothetical protein